MRLLAKDSDKVVLQLITIEMKTSGTLSGWITGIPWTLYRYCLFTSG